MSNFSCSLARNIIHTVGRTQLFIADSDERRLYYQFSLPHWYISLWKVVRMYFLNWLFSRSRQVKVISGDDRDNIGTLINIDDKDGIIKMDRTDQLKILPLEFLGKLSTVDIWAGYSPLPLPSLGSFLWNTWASWTLWTFELDTPLSPFPSLPPPTPLYPLPSRITVDIWAPSHSGDFSLEQLHQVSLCRKGFRVPCSSRLWLEEDWSEPKIRWGWEYVHFVLPLTRHHSGSPSLPLGNIRERLNRGQSAGFSFTERGWD